VEKASISETPCHQPCVLTGTAQVTGQKTYPEANTTGKSSVKLPGINSNSSVNISGNNW
jgi:hypothetical protein